MTTATVAPARGRRGTELALLVFAVALAMTAYAAVELALREQLPSSTLRYTIGLTLLFAVAHIVVRRTAPYADPVLLPAVALLNGLGLVMIHRLDLAAADVAADAGRSAPSADAPAQFLWTTVGIALFVGVLLLVRDHRMLERYTYTAAAVGFGLLLLPLLPGLGRTINGARIWIRAGGLSFQPGEFAKLALVVFFAGYLVAKRDVLSLASRRVLGLYFPRGRDLGPVVLAWLLSLGVLVFEKDLGSSLLFFGIFVATLYVATERTSWLVIGLGLFLAGALLAHSMFAHVQARVDSWLDPFAEAQGAGYQLVQGLFGMGTGGIIGTGLGQGRPDIVPEAKTDFIFAALGEELGLAGVMAVLVLYALVILRGIRSGLAVRDSFGKLLAAGLAFSLALQVFVVVGGVTRLIPLTGLTLPFMSRGGSSLVANYALIALLLRISNAARQPAPSVAAPAGPQTMAVALSEAPTQVVRK